MFQGILIEKDHQGYRSSLGNINDSVLPEGDVTVNVLYSTLNYKDALAITGKGPVVRSFPMIPGIDFVGIVEHSESDKFNVGDTVLLNGFGVGEVHCGGLAKKARVKSEWLIPLPTGFTPRETMAIGTAGYTAMLSVIALEKNGITPEHGDILVTGANGGVGSFAIAILSSLGFNVVASTGRVDQAAYLHKLGAASVIDRVTLSEPGKPLAKECWAAAIDSAGSHTLANVCAGIKYGGVVTACGLAQGMEFPASVAPFILRGISLIGIDSVKRSIDDRLEAWRRLADTLDTQLFDDVCTDISLSEVINTANNLISGKIRGRVVVDLNHENA